jgi:hypothetical protein
MPYTVILGLADSAGANWQRGEVADVFSPRFEQAVRQQARKLCTPRAQDPYLLRACPTPEAPANRWGRKQDRADHFERYVRALVRMPFVVGYHWFEYFDQPAEGRFDGENSNYGLVSGQDEPWDTLVQRVTQVNARLEQDHLINDQSVLDVQDSAFTAGYIFLQQHHKTGVCEFRDIRVQGLQTPLEDGESRPTRSDL